MIKIIFALGFLLIPACLAAQLNRDIRRDAGQARALVGVSCSLPGLVLDCNLNANEKLPMQSVYKFPIGLAILHAVEQGQLVLSQPIVLSFRFTEQHTAAGCSCFLPRPLSFPRDI